MTKISKQFLFTILAILVSSCTPSNENNSDKSNWDNHRQNDGFDSVLLYTPSQKPKKKNSLLVLLHGCLQKNTDLQKANIEEHAEKYNFVVAIPQSQHPQGLGCWAYWQGMGSRGADTKNATTIKTKSDYTNLISLAKELVADPILNIDSGNVIIAGMSSGATFAGQTACLAPDVFSGVVMMAGPSIGTSAAGALKTCELVSPDQFSSDCKTSAGNQVGHLNLQRALIAMGSMDTTVHDCYNKQNALGFASAYGVSQPVQEVAVETKNYSGNRVTETTWDSNRVRMINLDGVDHSWPGGPESAGAYVSSNSISLIEYLMEFMVTTSSTTQEIK